MRAVTNLGGDEWEERCILLIQRRYDAGQVQVVAAKNRGDLGIDAFTYGGFAFTCHAAQEPVTVRGRYEKQRAKLTTEVAKLVDRQDAFLQLLGNVKIRRYVFMVPFFDSHELVLHASIKAAECRGLNLPYLDSDFQIVIVDQHSSLPHQSRPDDRGITETSQITEVTRLRLFDALRKAGTVWYGSADEISFLRRLYDLHELESTDLRFPTAEGDIIQHRYNNPGDWEDDWVFADPRFQLADGPDGVLLRFLAEMIHPAVRTDGEEVKHLLALFNTRLAADGYELAPEETASGYQIYLARSMSQVHREAAPPVVRGVGLTNIPAVAPRLLISDVAQDSYNVLRNYARGDRNDYRCAQFRLPDSGQADVFEATHKQTKISVALKKLHQKHPSERQIARMRREIEIGLGLDGHPHAVPILDHGPDHTWFVMPWADATAKARQTVLQNEPDELRALVDALASVLHKAHADGWLHRDIKASNILYLDNRWTLADWGIVRRPRGETTKVGRTGTSIGTAGFAAPELSVNPHSATFSSDIYSIGRVIAWALTGEEPLANLSLLPPQPGPWRNIVKKATNPDPMLRPQTIPDLISLIEVEFTEAPVDPIVHATRLIETASEGDQSAADAFLALLADHPGDYGLYIEQLTQLAVSQAGQALERDLPQAHVILRSLAEHVDGDGTRWVQFGEAATVVSWLHNVACYAASRRQWDLLEDATDVMCIWDAAWDQWRPQKEIRSWLESLRGEAAVAVASVLRQHEGSARHFSGLAENRTVDPRIRQAVRNE
ncbi:AbiJ-related protein [Streptomyces mirabilis]|uniref:AbiJ-related protein n=1 Tax=Streptomyces mirabilis TaxID=68239 RepID=UPI0036DB734A